MKVAIGCDPNAMDLKKTLIKVCEDMGCDIIDMGSEDPVYANTVLKLLKK